ncbi:MAG: branched-chain amino acid ABC transporter permease, partial [Proteobacteria bacterium]|nr:branched-chain amino acid ABC transporter permease [Pseudomonadota bacterium]
MWEYSKGKSVKYTQWIIFGLVIGAIWTLGFLFETNLNPYVVRVIVNCGIAMILAMSLNLVNGCAGQFSLGHAGFMGEGAYLSAAITTLLPVAFPQL